MKTTFKWSMTTLLLVGIFSLAGCGGGGGGGGKSAANDCSGNSDSFICEVFKVVNNLTSDTSEPNATDTITATSPENTEPTTNI